MTFFDFLLLRSKSRETKMVTSRKTGIATPRPIAINFVRLLEAGLFTEELEGAGSTSKLIVVQVMRSLRVEV